jgi:hypothetical protein
LENGPVEAENVSICLCYVSLKIAHSDEDWIPTTQQGWERMAVETVLHLPGTPRLATRMVSASPLLHGRLCSAVGSEVVLPQRHTSILGIRLTGPYYRELVSVGRCIWQANEPRRGVVTQHDRPWDGMRAERRGVSS